MRCADGSLEAVEQLAGSAPTAVGWLALEQDGPWGAKAFTASRLDPAVGRAVEEAAATAAVRPVLVRRPGPHPDVPGPRHLLVAHTAPGRTWLLEGVVERPETVLALDWAALRAGDAAAVRRSLPTLSPSDRTHLLVCTNGRRDVCCAVRGRPLALALAGRRPGVVWEVTHTSGHRFAPTAVLLPAGTLHGRLDPASAERLLDAAARGETVLEGSRGRSTWAAPAQVAELAVREADGELALDALEVADLTQDGDHRWRMLVVHRDGRRWRVEVASEDTGVDRAESCGKAAVALRRWSWTVSPGPDGLR